MQYKIERKRDERCRKQHLLRQSEGTASEDRRRTQRYYPHIRDQRHCEPRPDHHSKNHEEVHGVLLQVQPESLIQDLRRHNSHPLPFAKNTHFQSQIVRVASLHQNSLHALQIFHKSIQQTACMGDSGDLLKSLLQTVLEMGQVCGELVVPPGLGATNLYLDSNSCSKRSSRLKTNMKSAKWSRPGGPKSFGETEPRLSMYSLDLNLHSRSNMRDNHSG
ncbi:unnamed protein product [Leptidea sinapis]|uniref:Uncharacterized protein n=1 Tax=Leptidea sinapis TaxID=189913 RepID=A0A5E4R285_9NEOP|nr:unnamed protein product [Leptidea sinapis]